MCKKKCIRGIFFEKKDKKVLFGVQKNQKINFFTKKIVYVNYFLYFCAAFYVRTPVRTQLYIHIE